MIPWKIKVLDKMNDQLVSFSFNNPIKNKERIIYFVLPWETGRDDVPREIHLINDEGKIGSIQSMWIDFATVKIFPPEERLIWLLEHEKIVDQHKREIGVYL